MMFYAYILKCADASYYTGHTENIEARLLAHDSAYYKCYTSTRRPVQLVWCEGFETREEALGSERQIKGSRRSKKDALIAGDWQELVRLARMRRVSLVGRMFEEATPRPQVRPSSASGRTAGTPRTTSNARTADAIRSEVILQPQAHPTSTSG
jgi:predicted GIY-YIG superfamily endonuclease